MCASDNKLFSSRDAETGQIKRSGLSSVKAKELAERRWAKERDGTLSEILQLYGFETPE